MDDSIAVRTFWYFVRERQKIWYRRYALKQKFPWTDDLVLRAVKIINIYRELDWGTKFAVEHILENDKLRLGEMIGRNLVYRYFNRITTYLEIEPYLEIYDKIRLNACIRAIEEHLEENMVAGLPLYTGAYMNSGVNKTEGSTARTCAVMVRTLMDFGNVVSSAVENGTTSYFLSTELKKIKGIGPFLGHQMALDFTYPLVRNGYAPLVYGGGSWCWLGPGAIEGLRILGLGGEAGVRLLWESQLDKLGYDFNWLSDWQGKRYGLTMSNIEGCLCEFARYWRALGGGYVRGWVPNGREHEHWKTDCISLPAYGDWKDSNRSVQIWK